jgi:hypothetical protein
MSTPLTADQLVAALEAEGVNVVGHSGWRTNNRNHKGAWGPVQGVVIHHTVTTGTTTSVELCFNGHSTLPGPLCHGVIAKDGTVHLVGNGRANHAGLGDPDVLAAVIAEKAPPADDEASVDGNARFYGFECVNLGDGKDPWPAVQVDAIVRAAAALCRAHGWGFRSVIRHLDWQPGKVDPRGPGMDWTAVQAAIAKRLGTGGATTPLPTPAKPKVSLSKLAAAAKSNPKAAGTPVTYAGVKTVETALVDAGYLAKAYLDGHYGTTTVEAYAKWQRHLGYTGSAADGVPGKASLTKLGDRYGFTVVA